MSKPYKYIDPAYTYTYPKTGVLKNLLEITDPEVLLFVESGAVSKRLLELYEHPIKIKSVENLFAIHKQLFQDIYSWAGKTRTVEISKDGKQFFPTAHFDNAFSYIDTLLSEFKAIPSNNKKKLAEKLAVILDNVNYLHPFREGNGRAQRVFKTTCIGKRIIFKSQPTRQQKYLRKIYEGNN